MFYGGRLKQLREEKNLTQKAIESDLGLSDSQITKWERAAYPPLHAIEKVCNYLKVPLWRFFMIEGDQDDPISKLHPQDIQNLMVLYSLPIKMQNVVIKSFVDLLKGMHEIKDYYYIQENSDISKAAEPQIHYSEKGP